MRRKDHFEQFTQVKVLPSRSEYKQSLHVHGEKGAIMGEACCRFLEYFPRKAGVLGHENTTCRSRLECRNEDEENTLLAGGHVS